VGARCVWFFGVNRSLLMCRIWRAIECWHVGQHRQADGRQRDRRSTDTGLHHPTDFLHRLVCRVKSSKVNRWIYTALYYKPFVSKALGYGPRITRESHNAVLPATHTRTVCLPLLPSRKASPFFGWYSLPLPTKWWLGWVDLGGWLHTEINVRHTELNPRYVVLAATILAIYAYGWMFYKVMVQVARRYHCSPILLLSRPWTSFNGVVCVWL